MSHFQESHARLSNGRSVYFYEEGAGPPFLFVHGGAGSADYMRAMTEILRDRFRCIALDRIGYRRSGSLDRITTLEEQGEAILGVHRACTSDPLWVFGHSSGGNFAIAYALAYPERVRGLVLMEPALYQAIPPEDRSLGLSTMIDTVGPLLRAGRINEGVEQFSRFLHPEISPEALAKQEIDRLSPDDRMSLEAFAMEQPLVVDWSPTPSEWAQLTQPTLVIEGDLTGEVLRSVAVKLADLLPHGEIVTLRGIDHGAPGKAPDKVAQTIVEFTSR